MLQRFSEFYLTEDFTARLPVLVKKWWMKLKDEYPASGVAFETPIAEIAKEFDPTYPQQGMYVDWLIKQDIELSHAERYQDFKNSLRFGTLLDMEDKVSADRPYIKNMLAHFNKYKKLYKFQDINRYTLHDLKSESEQLQNVSFVREVEKEGKKGAALIYDKDDVQIRKIATPEAAILYGRNSKWCTAATDKPKDQTIKVCQSYLQYGPLYIIHYEGKPFAQLSTRGDFMDAQDEAMFIDQNSMIVPIMRAIIHADEQLNIPPFADITSSWDIKKAKEKISRWMDIPLNQV